MKSIITNFKKYCYISCPVIVTIFFIFINKKIYSISVSEDRLNAIIGLLGTLVGFLLMAITVFLSLPKENIVIKRVKKYKHHKIFTKCILLGIFFSCLTILFWVMNFSVNLILITFLISISETMIAAYYIYLLCLYSFEEL